MNQTVTKKIGEFGALNNSVKIGMMKNVGKIGAAKFSDNGSLGFGEMGSSTPLSVTYPLNYVAQL